MSSICWKLLKSSWHTVFFGLMAVTVLVGCSSIQIDVDVYKGPLINDPDIQMQQYASLAIAHYPIIVELRDAVQRKMDDCGKNPDPCDVQKFRFTHKFIACYVLPLYEDELTEDVATCAGEYQDRPSSEGINNLAKKGLTIKKDSSSELNKSLVFFAQQVLIVVNNQTLFEGDDTMTTHRAILQSLGNTIIVHANDLQRQQNREEKLRDRANAERLAIERIFSVTPVDAYQQLVQTIKLRAVAEATLSPAVKTDAKPLKDAALQSNLKNSLELLSAAKNSESEYRKSLAPLIAAYCTLLGDPVTLFSGVACENNLANSDRAAITALYNSKPIPAGTRSGRWAIDPLIEWLDAEMAPSATPLPTRTARLQRLKEYLIAEQDRLAVATADVTTRADAWKIISSRLTEGAQNTSKYLSEQTARMTELSKKTVRLEQRVTEANARESERVEKQKQLAATTTDVARALAILDLVRSDVLTKANEVRTSGLAQVHQLLKTKLDNLEPAAGTGKPSRDDIDLAKRMVGALVFHAGATCETESACSRENQIDVIDTLISSLRAQRIQALVNENNGKAEYLMLAINAAHDQRTALLYLRPASDYLRSVYSASTLQNETEPIYRNMLDDWKSYFNFNLFGSTKDKTQGSAEKTEVEKLYWQNINRVTVGGGGATNYVLAKDDVGNWYVKAYGSDPEAILKSATSLALFNAGTGINTNLLRRYDLQRMADDPKTSVTDKQRHVSELAQLDAKEGVPLLRVRDRYEKRYVDDTRQHALSVHGMLKSLPEKVAAVVEKAVEPPDSCKIDEMKKTLEPLEKTHLETARETLGRLLDPAGKSDQKRGVETFEKAVQQGLTAAFLYGGQVHRKLIESQAIECNESWRRGVAAQARAVPHAQLLMISVERRQSIERYEEALTSIADVATESR